MDRKMTVITNRIGIADGQNLYDDEYDFDEMNPEITKMFMEENNQKNGRNKTIWISVIEMRI